MTNKNILESFKKLIKKHPSTFENLYEESITLAVNHNIIKCHFHYCINASTIRLLLNNNFIFTIYNNKYNNKESLEIYMSLRE